MADPTNDEALLEPLKKELRPEEGFVATAYYDSRHILTIAYGFNLTRPDADALLTQMGLSPAAVRSGKWPLTRDQGERLLDITARGAIAGAISVIGADAWSRLPDVAKVVLADMEFNMGSGGLGGFHLMLAALRREPPDYAEAERQMNSSQWDRQVPARADELEAIILSLIPTVTDADRARIASLFIPTREATGAHAGDDDAPSSDVNA
jgi:GH24 family phage-related lysozyme (muramidase)